MRRNKKKAIPALFAGFLCLNAVVSRAQQAKKPFTVADEIGLWLFVNNERAVQFSPDGNYFAAYTERGRLDLNRVEDSLRFYRSQDVEHFLEHSDVSQPPSPVWTVNRSGKEGPIINGWRWLRDSSGVAFLQGVGELSNKRLMLADLKKKAMERMSLTAENVKDFDIRDRKHYVYTAAHPAERQKMQARLQAERQGPAIIGTGRSLHLLLVPDLSLATLDYSSRGDLWAVVDGKRFEVKHDGARLALERDFALSPDVSSLVTTLPVPEVPSSWETLYPPPYVSSTERIHAGRSANQYVRIDLRTGYVQSLMDAPTSNDAGWWASGSPSWSSDGQAILLPATFIRSKDRVPSRPCVAIVDLPSDKRTCVEMLKARTETGVEQGYYIIEDARFVRGDRQRILLTFMTREHQSVGTTEYRRRADDTWEISGRSNGMPEAGDEGLKVAVKQSFNEPPMLNAANKENSRVIWDPNPQLKSLDFGQASVYKWKDKQGQEWEDGLYKPSDFKPGQRYPLVIQTHGFERTEFRPSGVFTAAYAADALAAHGIIVVQVAYHCPTIATRQEGPCMASNFEALARQLVSEGLVDPKKIGIIGFSRSCYHVMEMLTTSSLQLRAASITDGFLLDYFQYVQQPERFSNEGNTMIGAPPFGEGLQLWLKKSPGFNLDKINTPLLVVGGGRVGMLTMWEPYAGLRYLHKPVDLVLLNSEEHPFTNPAVRLASQGGSVDWFRFWLQDYEDPDPAKAEQYARWRGLRKLQEENDAKDKAAKEKVAAPN